MIDLGYYTLLASVIVCAWGFLAGIMGGVKESSAFRKSAERSVYANFFLLLLSSFSLWGLFLTDEFSVRYVASYSSREMPLLYKFSAFWGGQEGSLLFWALSISFLAVIAVITSRGLSFSLFCYFAGFLSGIISFFSFLVIATGNPFTLMEGRVVDGYGLNPLLQNWYMVIHPPSLFLGFAGVAIPFALVLSAMADRFRDRKWLQGAAAWGVAAWIFLTIGITLGGRWAYEELGWGGYWAWDPVENASLLPWLVMTGFVHSLIIYRWKGKMGIWSLVLLLAGFELTILGTFITRSGVLSSVHAFGNSSIGPFLLGFMVIAATLFLGLMIKVRHKISRVERLGSIITRDASMALNNWILTFLTLAVLIGTILPAISELFTGRKVSVDIAFYNRITWPIGLVLLFLLGLCTLLPRQHREKARLPRLLLFISATAGILSGISVFISGYADPVALAYFVAAGFTLTVIVWKSADRISGYYRDRAGSFLESSWRLLISSNRLVAANLVHIGVVMVMIGIVVSSLYTREETFSVREGESFQMEDYTLTFQGIEERRDPVKDILLANIEVVKGDRARGVLTPQKHFHLNHEQPMTEIDLDQTLFQDLYLILYGWDGQGNFSFRVIINPLVRFIWWGVALMSLAGSWRLLGIVFERQRKREPAG